MPDQRSLLRGRLATAIDGVADVAAQLHPPAARSTAPPPPPAPPGRPWSPAAAMERIATPLPQVTAPNALPPMLPPDEAPAMEPLAHHRLPAALIGSLLLGFVLVLVVGLRLLHSTPDAPSAAPAPIALTAVRPLASAVGAGGVVPQTQVSFPAGTPSVSVEVNASAAGQAPVEIVVSVGEPAQTIIDHSYVLASTGETIIALAPGAGSYPPGDYTVTITNNGAAVGSTAFEVR